MIESKELLIAAIVILIVLALLALAYLERAPNKPVDDEDSLV